MRLAFITCMISILFYSCVVSNSPESNWKWKIRMKIQNECHKNDMCYVQTAKTDFEHGNLRLFVLGPSDNDSVLAYLDCLQTKRNIEIIGIGDVGPFSFEKYNSTMITLLLKRYGNDFFDSCHNTYTAKYKTDPYRYFR